MKLDELGFTEELSEQLKDFDLTDFSVARVTQEHRERYIVSDGENEFEAEITGNFRFTAASGSDFPAVGDWVIIKIYDSNLAIIHKVLPRKTVLARQSAGKPVDEQIISANIDTAFIVQAISNNFNINRLERYLTICYNSGIEPVLVLTKTDLVTEQQIQDALSSLNRRIREIKYFLLSNKTLQGLDRILEFIEKGRTYCVIGSSGVGKSTLINNLAGRELLRTGEISHSTNKGRHVTEHRELFVLDNGGIIIDNPGMKELGMTEVSEGIKTTFGDITEFASKCRYPDCRHVKESGCAVIDAVNKGLIDQESYSNYLKMVREKERYETTISEKRKKDKIFGKILKRYKKENF